jgi:hypothetical protein
MRTVYGTKIRTNQDQPEQDRARARYWVSFEKRDTLTEPSAVAPDPGVNGADQYRLQLIAAEPAVVS